MESEEQAPEISGPEALGALVRTTPDTGMESLPGKRSVGTDAMWEGFLEEEWARGTGIGGEGQ